MAGRRNSKTAKPAAPREWTIGELTIGDDEVSAEVEGVDAMGRPFRGTLRILLADGVADGWDWTPTEGCTTDDPDDWQAAIDELAAAAGVD